MTNTSPLHPGPNPRDELLEPRSPSPGPQKKKDKNLPQIPLLDNYAMSGYKEKEF